MYSRTILTLRNRTYSYFNSLFAAKYSLNGPDGFFNKYRSNSSPSSLILPNNAAYSGTVSIYLLCLLQSGQDKLLIFLYFPLFCGWLSSLAFIRTGSGIVTLSLSVQCLHRTAALNVFSSCFSAVLLFSFSNSFELFRTLPYWITLKTFSPIFKLLDVNYCRLAP